METVEQTSSVRNIPPETGKKLEDLGRVVPLSSSYGRSIFEDHELEDVFTAAELEILQLYAQSELSIADLPPNAAQIFQGLPIDKIIELRQANKPLPYSERLKRFYRDHITGWKN